MTSSATDVSKRSQIWPIRYRSPSSADCSASRSRTNPNSVRLAVLAQGLDPFISFTGQAQGIDERLEAGLWLRGYLPGSCWGGVATIRATI